MMQYQRGLSLLGVAIFMALLAASAMAGLYWMRYERNPLVDGWNSLMKSGNTAETLKKAQKAGADAKHAVAGMAGTGEAEADADAAPGALRKCIVEGRVTYSNVECSARNATSRKVVLHDSQGIDAPKKPAVPNEETASATLHQKALEQAVEKATH